MRRIGPKVLAWSLAALLTLAITGWLVLLRPVAQAPTNDPIALFDHGSIGNEEAQGLPYWIWRVLPTLFSEYLPGNQDGYASIGVYWQAGDELPIGFAKKTLGIVPRVSINCAFCHQGSYRLYPNDPSTLVPGGPGTRVNPQGYIRFLANAGSDARFTADRIMQAITAIYAMPMWERALYRTILIPFTKSALQKQKERFAWTYERPEWGVGRIDPFNPVKFANLGMNDDHTIGNSDIMPLWALDHTAFDPSREYSLHWDGLNRNLHEVVVSGAIGDGTTYKSFPGAEKNILGIEQFIRLQRPPASPFSSDRSPSDPYYVAADQVLSGRAIYDRRCGECHSPGAARFRRVVPSFELGTDLHRIEMWNGEARRRYNAYEKDYSWHFTSFQQEDGYVATELTGLWLKGPYLHNGSVPTLRDLLSPSTDRPKVFYRGHDLVDTDGGGFVSQGPDAQRYGWRYDTAVPGNGNAGHEFGTDMTPDEKGKLLAYLKTL